MSQREGTKTEKVILYICDFCGKECRSRCVLCGRDVCGHCLERDPFDYQSHADNPPKYCKKCYALPEREALQRHLLEADAEYERLEEAWRTAARANVASIESVHAEVARLKDENERLEDWDCGLGRWIAMMRLERVEREFAQCREELAAAKGQVSMLEFAGKREFELRKYARALLAEAEKTLEDMLNHPWDATTLERKTRAVLARIREGK